MRNIKVVLEYDGTGFCGWQWQPKGRTVEGEFRSSLKHLFQETPTVYAAGRTDSGVHALGQVVNFKIENGLATRNIQAGLNQYLPPDIRVRSVGEESADFHSRYSARSRTYRYIISRYQRAVLRSYSWYCKYALDFDKMESASGYLKGRHSFEAFSRKNTGVSHYLCDVREAGWTEKPDTYVFEIRANRFLHNMIRIIVGTLVDVGRGKMQPDDVRKILENRDRKQAGLTLPAQGLFLVGVEYELT